MSTTEAAETEAPVAGGGTADTHCEACGTDMGAPRYAPGAADGVEGDEGAYRLPCGHAFHTECLVRSWQAKSACLKCFTNADHETSEGWGDVQFVEMVGTPPQVHQVRSNDARVREARRRLREVRTQYNVQRARLKEERRAAVAAALVVFRRANLAGWRRAHREYVRELRRVRDVEQAALERMFPDGDIHISVQRPETYTSEGLEPTRRRFWVG